MGAKSDMLGPEVAQLTWHDYTSSTDVNCLPTFPEVEKGVKTFIEDVAPHWFQDSVRSKTSLTKFATKIQRTFELQKEIAANLYGDPLYVGLHHQNGNTDNCYFFKREDGVLDCGVFDWGSTCHLAYGTGFQGITLSAMGEMLAEYDDKLVVCWADAYHETGAPKLDVKELIFKYRIATCVSANGIFASANSINSAPETVEKIKGCPAYQSEEVLSQEFHFRFGLGMLYNRIQLFALKGDTYWDALTELKSRLHQDSQTRKA